MSNDSMLKTARRIGWNCRVLLVQVSRGGPLVMALALLLALLGCSTTSSSTANFDNKPLSAEEQKAVAEAAHSKDTKPVNSESLVLREGDTIRILFPGAPNLNVVQPIRRDGKISLSLVGEVQAAGKTPKVLEKELVELYGPQLQDKEVTVSLESSVFPVYITGAVLRPGTILSDRPLKM